MRRRLMLSKCNRCITVRSLISQIHLLSTSPPKNKMPRRTVFHINHSRQPLTQIPSLKSLQMRPLLTISSPELQGKQKLPSLGNLTLPQYHRQRDKPARSAGPMDRLSSASRGDGSSPISSGPSSTRRLAENELRTWRFRALLPLSNRAARSIASSATGWDWSRSR